MKRAILDVAPHLLPAAVDMIPHGRELAMLKITQEIDKSTDEQIAAQLQQCRQLVNGLLALYAADHPEAAEADALAALQPAPTATAPTSSTSEPATTSTVDPVEAPPTEAEN